MIEMMIVLLLLTTLLIISASLYSSPKTVSTSFETQLTNDLHYAQLYAIKEQQYLNVRFDVSLQAYKVIVGYPPNERVLIEVKLPDNVELLETSTLKQFRYNPTGNTTTFGVVRFKVDDSPVNIHFHLAKGRFYVEKP